MSRARGTGARRLRFVGKEWESRFQKKALRDWRGRGAPYLFGVGDVDDVFLEAVHGGRRRVAPRGGSGGVARVIIALGTARESGRPGRRNAHARANGTEGEFVMHHALRDDVQNVYLVALATKVLERPVDHHLAVRRAVDGEQDLAQRQGRLGLVHGGHLVPGGEGRGVSRRTGGVGNSETFFWRFRGLVAPRERVRSTRRDAHAR